MIWYSLSVVSFIVIFAGIFYTPYFLAKGVLDVATGGAYGSDKVKCAIPFYNVCIAWNYYFNKLTFMPIIINLGVIVSLIFRVYLIVTLTMSVTLATISYYLLILFIVFYYILNVVFVYIVLRDSDTLTTSSCISKSILYPYGQVYIGRFLSTTINKKLKRGDTFAGKAKS